MGGGSLSLFSQGKKMSFIKKKFISGEMTTDDELTLKQSLAEKNQPNGYAGLNASGKIPEGLLPIANPSESLGTIEGGTPTSIYLTESLDGGTV